MEGTEPIKSAGTGTARFSVFEFDLETLQLRRRGQLVNLQQQPLVLLAHLVQNAGVVISREQLQNALWPNGTYVEYELGIYSAINRLRRELGDSPGRPQFIETVPKKGYRFIAHVEFEAAAEDVFQTAPVVSVPDILLEEKQAEPIAAPPIDGRLNGRRRWAIFALLVGLVLAAGSWIIGRHFAATREAAAPVYRYTVSLGSDERLISLAISPAGDQMAYEAAKDGKYELYRRNLDEDQARPIRGSEGGRHPFYSPDGASVGFYTEGRLKVASEGGIREVARISPDIAQWDAVWGSDGFIYFYGGIGDWEGVLRVSEKGGSITKLLHSTMSASGTKFRLVSQFLTGGEPRLLYTENSGQSRQSLRLLNLKTGADQELLARGIGAFRAASGQLIYFWRNSLYAVAADRTSLKPIGSPVEVVKNVEAFQWSGSRSSISDNGTLIYAKVADLPLREIVWLDRNGKVSKLPIPPGAYEQADVSPDGSQIAIVRREDHFRWALWIYNVKAAVWSTVLHSDFPRIRVVWSPDGKSIIASTNREGFDFVNLVRVRLDASNRVEPLTNEPIFSQFPQSWTAKGEALAFLEGVHANSGADIMLLPMDGSGVAKALIATTNWEKSPTFSPSGDQIAYQTGQPENSTVRIQRYNSAEQRVEGAGWDIPDEQAHDPLWSRDGKRLFYLNKRNDLMWINPTDPQKGSEVWVAAIPKPPEDDWWTRSYSIDREGRILTIRSLNEEKIPSQIHVVVNWASELNRLCPMPARFY